jgi:hypothetical protein
MLVDELRGRRGEGITIVQAASACARLRGTDITPLIGARRCDRPAESRVPGADANRQPIDAW